MSANPGRYPLPSIRPPGGLRNVILRPTRRALFFAAYLLLGLFSLALSPLSAAIPFAFLVLLVAGPAAAVGWRWRQVGASAIEEQRTLILGIAVGTCAMLAWLGGAWSYRELTAYFSARAEAIAAAQCVIAAFITATYAVQGLLNRGRGEVWISVLSSAASLACLVVAGQFYAMCFGVSLLDLLR